IARMQAYGRSRAGFTHIVFGHFHEKLVLDGPPTITVLPAWYETGEAMVISPETGSFDWVTI
ncbi:MAG: hypothetical protein QOE82_2958, partial [Thermoanaerobaculia bacterium]|nr:hypothetical protein [Thermoanaerobaculia bacterium]